MIEKERKRAEKNNLIIFKKSCLPDSIRFADNLVVVVRLLGTTILRIRLWFRDLLNLKNKT